MEVQTTVYVFQAFLSLGVLAFGYFYMYRRTKVDRYREDLFTLRDDLFDYMWKHDISFDLPAYRLLRQLLNGAIRAADTVTPWSFLALAVVRRDRAPDDRLSIAFNSIQDEAVRTHFLSVQNAFAARFLTFLFAEGLLGLFIGMIRDLHWFQRRIRTFFYSLANLWSEPLVTIGSERGVLVGWNGKRSFSDMRAGAR